MDIYVGTSGIQSPSYLTELTALEINMTFYRLPSEAVVNKWKRDKPPDFVYCTKASRLITHYHKSEYTLSFVKRMEPILDKKSVILFQFPDTFGLKRMKEVDKIVSVLPDDYKYAFEFRSPEWHTKEVMEMMPTNMTMVCANIKGKYIPDPHDIEFAGDFKYVRMHGTEDMYKGSYSDAQLKELLVGIKEWENPTYVFFNNTTIVDGINQADYDAHRLLKMISKEKDIGSK